jgi:hypothetical protein
VMREEHEGIGFCGWEKATPRFSFGGVLPLHARRAPDEPLGNRCAFRAFLASK